MSDARDIEVLSVREVDFGALVRWANEEVRAHALTVSDERSGRTARIDAR